MATPSAWQSLARECSTSRSRIISFALRHICLRSISRYEAQSLTVPDIEIVLQARRDDALSDDAIVRWIEGYGLKNKIRAFPHTILDDPNVTKIP